MLASRIDLLDAADKRVLQSAAVVGRVFWPGPVSELTGTDEADLSDAFRRLEDRELVFSRAGSTWSGQPEYLFKHILTRDVAYESLPRRDRQAAHRSVADWVERTAGERTGEFAELLAYHYSTAVASVGETGDAPDPELRAAALRWLLRASRDARQRMVVKKAERMAEEALALAADDLERTDALEALADAFFDQYLGDLAWRYFREAAMLRARADPPDGARVAYLAARGCEVPAAVAGVDAGKASARVRGGGAVPARAGIRAPRRQHRAGPIARTSSGVAVRIPGQEPAQDEMEEFVRVGLEAAEMALRIGEPDLASGALDQASAAWVAGGWYGRAHEIWERRHAIIPLLTERPRDRRFVRDGSVGTLRAGAVCGGRAGERRGASGDQRAGGERRAASALVEARRDAPAGRDGTRRSGSSVASRICSTSDATIRRTS